MEGRGWRMRTFQFLFTFYCPFLPPSSCIMLPPSFLHFLEGLAWCHLLSFHSLVSLPEIFPSPFLWLMLFIFHVSPEIVLLPRTYLDLFLPCTKIRLSYLVDTGSQKCGAQALGLSGLNFNRHGLMGCLESIVWYLCLLVCRAILGTHQGADVRINAMKCIDNAGPCFAPDS